MITLRNSPDENIIELGGGAHPQVRPNVDVRMCHDAEGRPTVDIVADFDKPLPIQSEEWHAVFSHFVIEHLSWRNVRQFISEVYRILKPGGRAVVVTANTEAQFKWLMENQQGWDGKPSFESFSCIIFGDQDYPENTHKNFMCPALAEALFKGAGFDEVNVQPYGARSTDMCIVAGKPTTEKKVENESERITSQIAAAVGASDGLHAPQESAKVLEGVDPKQVFSRGYFNGGSKFGSCVPPKEFYWDHPSNELVFDAFMRCAPKSVLEIGAGRGYIAKRINDRNVHAVAVDVSDHCWLTRVVHKNNFVQCDLTKFPWPIGNKEFDVCLSVNFLQYLDPSLAESVVREINRVSHRSWHAVRSDHSGREFDRAVQNDHGLRRWSRLFGDMEAVSSFYEYEEVASGTLPAEVLKGDGKSKLNLGCFMTQFHHGWLNIDQHELNGFANQFSYNYQRRDLLKGLEQKTGEVDMVYMSHVLEHFSYEQGITLLRECRRVINPKTGVMRISVPDAGTLAQKYLAGKISGLAELSEECEVAGSGLVGMYGILCSGHQSMYDWNTLHRALDQSGWEPICVEQGQGDPQMVRETLDMLPEISLFVEARPKSQ